MPSLEVSQDGQWGRLGGQHYQLPLHRGTSADVTLAVTGGVYSAFVGPLRVTRLVTAGKLVTVTVGLTVQDTRICRVAPLPDRMNLMVFGRSLAACVTRVASYTHSIELGVFVPGRPGDFLGVFAPGS
jgi:hypothetical protein